MEIESLLALHSPDLCYVSEANLWANVDTDERNIPGYSIYLPNTMTQLGHVRILLLAKNDLKIHQFEDHMDE